MRLIIRCLSTCLAFVTILWLCGFFVFVAGIQNVREPIVTNNLEQTDAIVVLTGGSERVSTGIELLESGRAKKMLISGVHKGLTLDGVLGTQPVPPELRACCIALGYRAGSTRGNALEARTWMENESYHSLRLVTANYHTPRSLLLFHAVMPEMVIISHPVAPDSVVLQGWWKHPGTVELLATEYSKYILARIKLATGY